MQMRGGERRSARSVLAFVAVLAVTSIPLQGAPAQEVAPDSDWDRLQSYIQNVYAADLARIPYVSHDPPALARNLGIVYGYVLGRLQQEAGDDRDAAPHLEHLEGLLRSSLTDLARVSATLIPSNPPIEIGPVWEETRRAMAGVHDAEVEDLFRAIGGRIPDESAPDDDWRLTFEDVMPHGVAPGRAGLDDPRQEREFGEFDGELPANVVLTGADSGARESLVLAVRLGDLAEVQRILETGTDPDAPDPTSWVTPLMMAQTAEIAAELLRFGADPRRTDREGATPLHHTIFAQEAERIAPLLVTQGADVNAPDDSGHTVLIAATLNRDVDAVVLALALGVDPEIRSADGLTALEYAVELEAGDLIALLRNAVAPREEPE